MIKAGPARISIMARSRERLHEEAGYMRADCAFHLAPSLLQIRGGPYMLPVVVMRSQEFPGELGRRLGARESRPGRGDVLSGNGVRHGDAPVAPTAAWGWVRDMESSPQPTRFGQGSARARDLGPSAATGAGDQSV